MTSPITPAIRESLYEVLDYLWRDEKKDWEERDCPQEGHIFNALRRVDSWLAENTGADDA